MKPGRRRALLLAAAAPWAGRAAADVDAPGVQRGRALQFPDDHGAHLQTRTEWWYVTGWLGTEAAPTHGFQITFFRTRTGLAQGNGSRFAARHLLFAHAAVTQLQLPRQTPRHVHDQRIVRWSGAADSARARALVGRGDVSLADWSLVDSGRESGWVAGIGNGGSGGRAGGGTGGGASGKPAGGSAGNDAGSGVPATPSALAMHLTLRRTQPLLLQGDAGHSRKGPLEHQASHYYSEPQLAVDGRLALGGGGWLPAASGRAWMDHEWSDAYLAPEAVGWDWIGINLFDGGALTAFVLRRGDGSPLWAGGSLRRPGEASRSFAAPDVRFKSGRRWRSPASGALYPVEFDIETPAGLHRVRALSDKQELDSRASTGTIYWEGLSELLDPQGRRVGLGYLELTGYAGALKM